MSLIFEKLEVYQRAVELAEKIGENYTVSQSVPRSLILRAALAEAFQTLEISFNQRRFLFMAPALELALARQGPGFGSETARKRLDGMGGG
jgi:hypothetical protein